MKKALRVLALILIVLLIASYFALNYAIENVLPYSAIRPVRFTKEKIFKDHRKLIDPSYLGLTYSTCNITVEDTIKLKGWFINSPIKPAKGTLFILHGIGSCKNNMLPLANIIARQGFNIVLYDSRANGESGGLNCTFGYFEKKDLSRFIDSAIVRYPNSAPYGVYGHSLGAAIAIQALAYDKRLKCGIAESSFSELRNTIRDYFVRKFYLRINSIPDRALNYAEQIAHFQTDSIQPALSAKMITQPAMIIHGMADTRISPIYGKKVYDNLSSKEKIWYPIPNGDHNNLATTGGDMYYKQIIEFLNKHMVE